MATTLYLRGNATTDSTTERASTHRGDNTAKLDGNTSGWIPCGLSTSRGAGIQTSAATATVAGATNGVEVTNGTYPIEWISEPVAADVTISGAVTCNVWASESNMSANVAINFVLDKISRQDYSITQIVKSARTTEVAVTTRAVNNFSATPGAGVSLNRGDRLRVRIFGDDAGTMASTYTFNASWGHTAGGADGDSYITLTENLTFETTDPTGTTLYLSDVAASGGINPGSNTEWEAWTSRGSGAFVAAASPGTGWISPVAMSREWYTRPLQAFTLAGLVKANIWMSATADTREWSGDLAVYITATDGTSPTLWARGKVSPLSAPEGNVATTTSTARTIYVAGDDTSVSDGQRLLFAVYADDPANVAAAGFGASSWITVAGTSPGADGYSYVILPQSVSEYVTSTDLNVNFLNRVYSQAVTTAANW